MPADFFTVRARITPGHAFCAVLLIVMMNGFALPLSRSPLYTISAVSPISYSVAAFYRSRR